MMTVYVYVMDTLADWELGHVTAELHSGRFFKADPSQTTGNAEQRFCLAMLALGRRRGWA